MGRSHCLIDIRGKVSKSEKSFFSAYYFYYHEETMVYSALAFSIIFGLFHECCGGWFTNNILAFSSIYIACSRLQVSSKI